MTDKKHKTAKNKSYIHEMSHTVPDWVNKLNDLKKTIKNHLATQDTEKINGVKFCHPFDVPPTKN